MSEEKKSFKGITTVSRIRFYKSNSGIYPDYPVSVYTDSEKTSPKTCVVVTFFWNDKPIHILFKRDPESNSQSYHVYEDYTEIKGKIVIPNAQEIPGIFVCKENRIAIIANYNDSKEYILIKIHEETGNILTIERSLNPKDESEIAFFLYYFNH